MRRFILSLGLCAGLAGGAGLVAAGEAPPGIDAPLKTGLTAPGDVALVIGNENYGKIADVPYAYADAAAVESFLLYTRGVPMDRVRMVKDASAAKMLATVEELAKLGSATGVFWIYYAGHGMADPVTLDRVLLGWDAEGGTAEMVKNGVSVRRLQAAAGKSGMKVMMLVDACYNGSVRSVEGAKLTGERVAVPESLLTQSGLEWAASAPSELAAPLASVGHGAFTWLALGALRGWADGERSGARDGVVTLEEAQMYVKKRMQVMQLTTQTPLVSSASRDADGAPVVTAEQWASPLSGKTGAQLEIGPADEVLRGLWTGSSGTAQSSNVSSAVSSNAGTGQASAVLINTGTATAWTAEDDTILASQEAKVRRAAREKAAAAQETDAAQKVKARQSAVASEWAQLEAVMGAPEQVGAEERAAVAAKVARWKADSVEVPGQKVVLTGNVTWNGRTKSLDGEYEEVAAKKVAVDNAAIVAKAEAWMRRVPAAAAVVSVSSSGSTGGVSDWTSPTLGKMKWIPPGTFTMGSPAREAGRGDDEKQHQVTLTKGFWLMDHEVTQGEWQKVIGSNPSHFKDCGATCPVESVNLEDIQAYIKKVSTRDRVTYRLPTEAEWEYAARGGQEYIYAGSNDINAVGWYGSNSGDTTHPGCQKQRNGYGLCDMSGNVWEWVQDWYGIYPNNAIDYINNISGSSQVARGGCWNFNSQSTRVAYRGGFASSYRNDNLGFRLVRSK